MRVADFSYALPAELIASRPVEPRHTARLLVSRPDQTEDRSVLDLPELLNAGDILVFNDTRVIPARLFGRRGDVPIELLLHRCRADGLWETFAKPMKRLRPHDRVELGPDFSANIIGREGDHVLLDFDTGSRTLAGCLEDYGHLPLPHYMNRADDVADRTSYQTLFACHDGAVAAPTASLHFTPLLMDRLAEKGISHAFITLHVGAGTFQPVRSDDTRNHVMHTEWAEVSPATADLLNLTRSAGGRIIAVGTTVARTLETAATEDGQIRPFSGDTAIFITPGYRFKAVNALMTNFHLPESTLIMLVAALIGLDRTRRIYRHAIENRYRFYSYGDSSLLFPELS